MAKIFWNKSMKQSSRKIGLLPALTFAALVAAGAHSASAQMYSNGPGFFMSLEGRYLQNGGNQMRLSPPSSATTDTDISSSKLRNDKDFVGRDWGGKAALDYRFPSNWDVGVSASGVKSQH